MTKLQAHAYTFLDTVLAHAAAHGRLDADGRNKLSQQLLQGGLRVLDALFPRRNCTTDQVQKVFAAVRIVLGYGLFYASNGDPQTAWDLLEAHGLAYFSRAGLDRLFPYFFLDLHREGWEPKEKSIPYHLYQRFAYYKKHPPKRFLVYERLVVIADSPQKSVDEPEQVLMKVLARTGEADSDYRLAEAQFTLFSAHNVEIFDEKGDPIQDSLEKVRDPAYITTHILIHRFLHQDSAPVFPKIVRIDDNLCAYIEANRKGKFPWDFDDAQWQAKVLPEIGDKEVRKRLCAKRYPLRFLSDIPEHEKGLFDSFCSGAGFVDQDRAYRVVDLLAKMGTPESFYLDETSWGPYLLSCALGYPEPKCPKTEDEKRRLLSALRDRKPNWDAAVDRIRRKFGQHSDLEYWLRETLIPGAEDIANRLQVHTTNRSKSRSLEYREAWEEAMDWLDDLHARI